MAVTASVVSRRAPLAEVNNGYSYVKVRQSMTRQRYQAQDLAIWVPCDYRDGVHMTQWSMMRMSGLHVGLVSKSHGFESPNAAGPRVLLFRPGLSESISALVLPMGCMAASIVKLSQLPMLLLRCWCHIRAIKGKN